MTAKLFAQHKVLAGVLCLWLALVRAGSGGNPTAVSEYQVKAALLFNFTKFTDWPATTFGSTSAPITIGILGEDPFGHILEDAVAGETIDGRAIQVRRLLPTEDPRGCQMLFLARSSREHVKEVLAALRGLPVLTVSESEGFCRAGGMVNFVVTNKTIQFEVNVGAAQNVGIRISSKLLNLPRAIKVETREE